MPNKTAERLLLRPGDQAELERLTRSSTAPAAAAQRARIVLLAAEGGANYVIAERVGVTRPTVNLWRARYGEAGNAGLGGHKGAGAPRPGDRGAPAAGPLGPPAGRIGGKHRAGRPVGPP